MVPAAADETIGGLGREGLETGSGATQARLPDGREVPLRCVDAGAVRGAAMNEPWQEMLTEQQRKVLNAACGDLASQITWHGNRLSKDDWRHFISGTVLGWRIIPGIDFGAGAPGFVMLGGSSLDLSKEQASKALDIVFSIGDAPWDYEPTQKRAVQWCDKVMLARGFNPDDFREMAA